MQEDFLHYIWKFKKFDFGNARTVDGNAVHISSGGAANFNSGPDFFNARLEIGGQQWAGNVEIHIKSSHWYAHQHHTDPAYDNVILHVVWEHDMDIYRGDNTVIPVLELKGLVSPGTMQNYRNLLLAPNSKWINCEGDFRDFDAFTLEHWLERIYLEKLQQKSEMIQSLLQALDNDWEAVLFQLLAKNFGLKINGSAFLSLAQSIDFRIIRKTRNSQQQLEALFFGQCSMLENKIEDGYFKALNKEYTYLKRKFQLNNSCVERPKYFRLRPDNFPNIRLSQLATLYARDSQLFSQILEARSRERLEEIVKVEASPYWKTHYNFGKTHASRSKILSRDFIDLIVINTVIPLRFHYNLVAGSGDNTEIVHLMSQIKAEQNSVVNKYNTLRPGTAATALQSQALLHLKNNYCDKNACLQCNLGVKLMRG